MTTLVSSFSLFIERNILLRYHSCSANSEGKHTNRASRYVGDFLPRGLKENDARLS